VVVVVVVVVVEYWFRVSWVVASYCDKCIDSPRLKEKICV